jgi:hypothetical protein
MSAIQWSWRPGFYEAVNWGRPDAVPRPICSVCCGALPEVPLQIWKADGSGAALCDDCVDNWLTNNK